ncbi:MAG: ABC transporter permease, partial [Gammaproteobacteria bacterium]|nr:ABC transporter permease [Gammaproteobacteria bacterium]
TPLRGNILFFYMVSAVYIFVMSGLGLTIAIFARNIAQATLMMLLIIFPMMFLSGSFTPPESMSTWMRYASLLSPMRYYIDFGFQVLFKGNGFIYVWHDIAGIMIFGIIIFGISLRYFKHLYNSVA